MNPYQITFEMLAKAKSALIVIGNDLPATEQNKIPFDMKVNIKGSPVEIVQMGVMLVQTLQQHKLWSEIHFTLMTGRIRQELVNGMEDKINESLDFTKKDKKDLM